MWNARLSLFFLILPFTVLASPTLDSLLSFQKENSYRDTLEGRSVVSLGDTQSTWTELGALVRFSTNDLERLGYKGEVFYRPLSFLFLGARLSHDYWFSEALSSTHFLFTGNLEIPIFQGFRIYGTAAWYERLNQLDSAAFLPRFFGTSVREHDFGIRMGGELSFSERLWVLALESATFDNLEVFNLNNPFIEAKIRYNLEPIPGSLVWTTRYQVLLGFGRLDRWTTGLGLTWDFR